MRCSDALRFARLACMAAVCMLGAAGGAAAQAVQVVNACVSDVATGGLNLATALAQGGAIRIECPNGQGTIQMTQSRDLTSAVSITGGGGITLQGPASGAMFTTSNTLSLANMILVNGNATVAGAIVSGDMARVTLDNVIVRNSPSAFLVRSLRAERSLFQDNGAANAEATGSAVINAESVELLSSEFRNNTDHPIAGGSWPAPDRIPLSRRVTIDESVFAGNPATVLLIDAKVSIRNSRFFDNGRMPSTARDSWSCCGGAITSVRSDVEIFDSDFHANGSSGFGGAIHAIASRLTVGRSTFADNQARAGGAITSFAYPPRVNIWGADDWTDLPRLVLSRVTFDGNKATVSGGAVLFAGPMQGDGLVMKANEALAAGGGIAGWKALALPDPYGGVADALEDNTIAQPDRIALSRSAIVDNRSGASGAALALANADAAMGNVIVARNSAGIGGAVTGTRLRLVNSVIAHNQGIGLEAPGNAVLVVGNSAIYGNDVNCALSVTAGTVGPNMQYPGSDCGVGIETTDPGLDSAYAPGIVSAARDAGSFGLCVAEPTVGGVDIYGKTRIGNGQVCDIGAVERDVFETAAAGLTFDTMPGLGKCLMWLLFFLVLLFFIVGFLVRRRKKAHLSTP